MRHASGIDFAGGDGSGGNGRPISAVAVIVGLAGRIFVADHRIEPRFPTGPAVMSEPGGRWVYPYPGLGFLRDPAPHIFLDLGGTATAAASPCVSRLQPVIATRGE